MTNGAINSSAPENVVFKNPGVCSEPVISVGSSRINAYCSGVIANLMSDPMLLEQKRLETYKWWITYCDNRSNQLQEIL